MSSPLPTPEQQRGSLADLCIRRPVFATVMNLFLLVLGIFSYRDLGVDQFPNVDIPTVTVTASLPGASPEEMETNVTKPLEEIINTVEGIDEMSSKTSEGTTRINIGFLFSRTKDAAAQDVRDKVNQIMPRLPKGVESPIIDKFDPDSAPVLAVCISGQRNMKELTFIAQKQIKENLETVKNVGAVTLAGGRRRAIQIAVNLEQLRSHNLTITDLRTALEQQNVEVPGGRVDQSSRELTLRTLGRVAEVSEFENLNIESRGGVPIKLRDVATITDSVEEPRSLTQFNGENAVTLYIRKQSGTNTVEVIDGIKKRLDLLRDELPRDLKLTITRDQSQFIQRSLDEVSMHLWLGAILVALTVFFFLHDWRGTLIASLAIPVSIIGTFAVMKWMGYTLNNFTMLGLVFAVGIVVDDAIVVVENIHRIIQERKLDGKEAASIATREIALAVVATTLSLVVIFLPVAFMDGRVGRFFSSYGVTVAVAIMVSLFVSFTLTPMLASRMLKHTDDEALNRKRAEGGMLMRSITRRYDTLLGWCLQHRWIVIGISLGVMSLTYPLGKRAGFDFIPNDDSSEFEVIVQTPEGTSLAASTDLLKEIEGRIRAITMDGSPGITDTLVSIGDSTGRVSRGEGNVTTGSIYCKLPQLGGLTSKWLGKTRSWSQFDLMKKVREVLRKYPDLRTGVQNITRISGGGSRNADLDVGLTGPDLSQLIFYADQLVEKMAQDGHFVDVDTSLSNRKPELQVRIDRDKAIQFGASVQEVATALRTAVGGEIVSFWKEGDEQYDVWVRAELQDRSTQEAIEQVSIRVQTPDGTQAILPLTNFVQLVESRGPAEIERFQRQRKITVMANLNGLALSGGTDRVREIAATLGMPPEYRVVLTGRAKRLQETMNNFLKAFGLALIFMYLILAAQFEHFIHPVSILLAVPLSLPFALMSMAMLNQSLDIYAIFGVFMLFGVVKKNGILQVDYTNTLRARGMERDAAIREANRVRLRPILMTTLLLIVSMIPIAVGEGPGAAGRASMAKVIIGGQLLCLLLSLLVTPVSYAIFDDWGCGKFWKKKGE